MNQQNRLLKYLVSMAVLAAVLLTACKDDEKPKLIPELTTTAITEITTTTAMGGGTIVADGNDAITASGICWSNTNALPTIADSKTELTTADGSFTSKMESLASGVTYHVRAYATNSVGMGYGEAVTFTTGNAAPVASNVATSGTAEVNKTLTGSYTYTDANNDAESGSTMQWYRASDASGTGEVTIAGATTSTYLLLDTDEFKYIRFGVTAKAATGNTTGTEVKSAYLGPIAVRTTVTFTYNGAEVTYGIITSSVTGRKWLDRNLGAPNVPTTFDDYANYGDLFQWGRGADGHQLINRSPSVPLPLNGTTTTLSVTDNPGNSSFILASASPFNWRNPENTTLWKGANQINNPCPLGWHIPSTVEWQAENLSLIQDAYIQLKLSLGGFRFGTDGSIGLLTRGYYWSTSISGTGSPERLQFRTSQSTNLSSTYFADAVSCRCMKD